MLLLLSLSLSLSLLLKYTTQCPRSGLEPGPLDPESNALTMRPPREIKVEEIRSGLQTFQGNWAEILFALALSALPSSFYVVGHDHMSGRLRTLPIFKEKRLVVLVSRILHEVTCYIMKYQPSLLFCSYKSFSLIMRAPLKLT